MDEDPYGADGKEEMRYQLNDDHRAIRDAVRDVCARFPGEYWRALDESGDYPSEFVGDLTDQGWLSLLIPEEYGGGGQGLVEAGIVLEEIHRSGANANACHAQMYTMGAVLRHGDQRQKETYLPEIASGELRLQAFAITEPDAGSDTTQIRTFARRKGDRYIVNGQKTFISRVAYTDLMLLLARTQRADATARRGDGLSLFLVDLREAGASVEYSRLPMMFNHHTYQVFFNDLEIPVENLVGNEGRGFYHVLDGMNAERILIASEAIGDGRFFLDRASRHASERVVFNRPLGANQGVAFPLAAALAAVESASVMRFQAASTFDAGLDCAKDANLAKYLASEASWTAANAAMATLGGSSFAVEYDIERKFRETKLLQIAPVNNNLILAYLAQHELGLPRSY